MTSSKELEALTYSKFWDDRYTNAVGDEQTHEWFRAYDALEPFFEKHLFNARVSQGKHQKVLHLGSGDSTIPFDLLARGYTNQLCIDFSTVLVDSMKSRHLDQPQIKWIVGDVRDMVSIESKSVDVAFDKGTMDAMIHGSPWSPPDDVLDNTGRYIQEVLRVLKDDGVFLYITYRQPHFMKPLLNRANDWDLHIELLGDGASFEYFGFVLKKNTSRPK